MFRLGAKGSVDPGWRSGRSPATPDRLRECNVPHTVPLCNTNIAICPTGLESGHFADADLACFQGIRPWAGFGARGRLTCRARCTCARCIGSCGPPTRSLPSVGPCGECSFVPSRSPRSCPWRAAAEGRPTARATRRASSRVTRSCTPRPSCDRRVRSARTRSRRRARSCAPTTRRPSCASCCATGAEDFDYDRDLKPWLGERAGFWASSDADGGGLAVLSATDVEKARESVAASFERDGETLTERTYRDVDVRRDLRGDRGRGGRRLHGGRPRGRPQAHDRRRRGRLAGRVRRVRGRRGRARRGPDRALLDGHARRVRAGGARRPGGRPAARGWCRWTSSRRWSAGSRRTASGWPCRCRRARTRAPASSRCSAAAAARWCRSSRATAGPR